MLKTKFPAHYLVVLFFPMFFAMSGCNNSGEKIPDVSAMKVALQTYRFDEDFSSIDTNHISEGLQKLNAKYPDFLSYYIDTLMPFGINVNRLDTSIAGIDSLRPFLTYKDDVNLEDTIKKYYPDNKDVDAQLTKGFQFMKYYFPNYFVPKIIYVNTYLCKLTAFSLDSTTLCIALDMFLGEQFPYYTAIGEPGYIGARKRKTYVPVSVFSTIYKNNHHFISNDNTLLDLMIQRGKEQYFLHKILPHTADSVLFALPDHKLKWCSENEGRIYNFFISQSLLYNKEPSSIMPYINEGPFASNFPEVDPAYNTPGNIGTWLGYKIVCAYMAQNPGMTLQQLVDQKTDAAQFLDAAKYRPK